MKLYSKEPVERMMSAMQSTGRFTHSYILVGDKGTGKKTCADYIAMQLLCDTENACGTCRQCRRILAGQHPDVKIPVKENKSKTYTVEAMRELVADSIVAPNDCDRKIYILPDCEGWKDAAQDALLKVTEEPPDSVYFIFTAQNRSTFLPTLISRSTVIEIPEATRESCIMCLTDEGKYEPEKILEAAESFGGNIGRCKELLDGSDELCEMAELVKNAAEAIISGNEYALDLALTQAGSSREHMRQSLDMLARVLRDACIIRTGGKGLIGSFRQGSVKLSERLSSEKLCALYEAVSRTSAKCTMNINTAIFAAALSGELMTISAE